MKVNVVDHRPRTDHQHRDGAHRCGIPQVAPPIAPAGAGKRERDRKKQQVGAEVHAHTEGGPAHQQPAQAVLAGAHRLQIGGDGGYGEVYSPDIGGDEHRVLSYWREDRVHGGGYYRRTTPPEEQRHDPIYEQHHQRADSNLQYLTIEKALAPGQLPHTRKH